MLMFPTYSLTYEVEKQIHFHVRQIEPTKYWGFRVAAGLTRISSIGLFLLVLLYTLTYMFIAHVPGVKESDLEPIVSSFALASVVVGLVAVSTHIIQDALRSQLLNAVRTACRQIN